MKKTGKTRRTRWLSCMVTLSLCLGSLGAAGAAPTKAEPELSTGGHPLIAAASVPETVRELIGLEADAPQKVVQTDNLYEILTENEDGSGQGTRSSTSTRTAKPNSLIPPLFPRGFSVPCSKAIPIQTPPTVSRWNIRRTAPRASA